MTQIEYLSLNGFERFFYNIGHFFTQLPRKTVSFGEKIPSRLVTLGRKVISPYEIAKDAALYGDWRTRLSFLIMGFGHMTRRQILRGALYFAYEVFLIIFMALVGGTNLRALGSLGQMAMSTVDINGMETYFYYDNSLTILIYSIVSLVFIAILIYLYFAQLKDSMNLQRATYVGIYASDKQSLKNVLDKEFHKTLLSVPLVGLLVFTVIPTFIMILVAFTNYNSDHLTPKNLIDWVGMRNFANIFASGGTGSNFLYVFGQVLLWTLVWAFFATFSNYFLGMIVAMLINRKSIKLKKLWRTILITTIAVPQFVSLLLVSQMFNQNNGVINALLQQAGWISLQGIPWLNDAVLSKFVIIFVNTWIGIPYTMLICTGLLMNIPADLYESAKIDGASPARTYFKITLPYMLFVTTPYLISQFVGNINNFNVIYLLSGGNPVFPSSITGSSTQLVGVGQTDLLITWIYKIAMTQVNKDYGLASVLGIMIFVVVVFFSLIFYSNSKSVKNEDDFQL